MSRKFHMYVHFELPDDDKRTEKGLKTAIKSLLKEYSCVKVITDMDVIEMNKK